MSAPSLIGKKRKTQENECEKFSPRLSSRDPSPMAADMFPDDGFRICRICLEPSASSSPCAAEEGKGASPTTCHQQHPHQPASQLLQSSAAHQTSNEDQLVSPCGCTGTQAYVHLKCLRRWQMAVMSSRHPGANYAPALICSVCTKRFSFAPPKPAFAMRLSGILDCYAREVAALIIFLCSCYVALAYHYNIRPILYHADVKLSSFAAFIRYGPPTSLDPSIELHLRSGVVLVASPGMRPQQSMFYRSVVLLYEHGRRGSLGVILNKPKVGEELAKVEDQLPHDLTGLDLGPLTHATGGPVLPHELMLLRRCPPARFQDQGCCSCSDGSMEHKMPRAGENREVGGGDVKEAASGPPGSPGWPRSWGHEILQGICLGTDLRALQLHRKVQEPSVWRRQGSVESMEEGVSWKSEERSDGSEEGKSSKNQSERAGVGSRFAFCGCESGGGVSEGVLVLHGRAKWAEGQLAREVGRGFWTPRDDVGSRLSTLPLQDLWEVLVRD